MSVTTNTTNQFYLINGDKYSNSHWILTEKDNIAKFIRVTELDTTFKVYSFAEQGFVNITDLEVLDIEDTIYSIHCEPYDNFFTDNMLVFDAFEGIQGDDPLA